MFCGKYEMLFVNKFLKRHSLVKNIQFRLIPMYESFHRIEDSNALEMDCVRYEYRQILVNIFRRIDATFIEKVFKEDNNLDWSYLAKALEEDIRADRLHYQSEMRKAISRMLTRHRDFNILLNPTKIIKTASDYAETDEERKAVASFKRFTTVLVEHFKTKKVYFSSDEKRMTIAYRMVHINFPLYLRNLDLLRKYSDAGINFSDKFKFSYLELNGYNNCLIQKDIEEYNAAVGKINIELQNLSKQNKIPAQLKDYSLRLSKLQRQVMSGSNYTRSNTFSCYDELKDSILSARDSFSSLLTSLDLVFNEEYSIPYFEKYLELRINLVTCIDNLVFVENEKKSTASIKAFLDNGLALRRFIKKLLYTLIKKEDNNLKRLSSACHDALEDLNILPSIYKKAYTYFTKKPYSIEKFRCYFNCAAFGKGWDLNKEADYLISLFRKQDKFYLGIRKLGSIIDYSALEDNNVAFENCYEKMIYKSFDFIKGFPSAVFSKLVLEKFGNGAEEIVFSGELYNQPFILSKEDFAQKFYIEDGKVQERDAAHTKYLKDYYKATGDYKGYLKAVHQRIDLAKRFIAAYKTFNYFDMSQLKPTEQYTSWIEFANHVNEFTYGISWQRIPESAIIDLVDRGDLFFFQLDNKDFSLSREGLRENEQTQLLRELFDDLNKRERVLKLLGDVKVFYRPASLSSEVTHKKGSILVNKIDKNNNPIDDEVYYNIYQYLNKQIDELIPEAKSMLDSGLVQYKTVKQDIVKDKRFTEDQMSVHFPVAINYRCPNRDYDFNKNFRSFVKENPNVNIIGVHLGGKSLAEVVIINSAGEIIYRKDYNEFNHYNYSKAISLRQQSRKQAQRNWEQMEKIKNLQTGFMGSLINEICRLILKYNAMVILEDYSFVMVKREKQPFTMQFATNLLHKLNYLVIKEVKPTEPGGILNGYQLAPKVESLVSFANQIGCVFFVLPNRYEKELPEQDIAYNVVLKGLILMRRIRDAKKVDKVDLAIKEKDWQEFINGFSAAK